MSDDRALISRAARRLGFGLVGGTLEAEVTAGAAAFRSKLFDPDSAGIPAAPALWPGDYMVTPDEPNTRRKQVAHGAIEEWLEHMTVSPRTHVEWLTWFWHGHFVVSQPEVRNPLFMVDNLRLLRDRGAGSFADLVTEIAKDPAMLLYLDGNDNQKEAPNENFSRELMELFTLGIGNYTEDDVDSGASALTGWKVDRNTYKSRLYSDRHDGEKQPFLGAEVKNLDGVVTTLLAQPALPRFVASRLGRQILGANAPAAEIDKAAAAFNASGFTVAALVSSLTDALFAGIGAEPILMGPVPWYLAARRATGAPQVEDVRGMLNSAGQLPWFCPTVGGWPFNDGWNRSSTHVGRFNLAGVIAETSPQDAPAMAAASANDNAALAAALGLGADFSSSSWSAISSQADAPSRLTLALVSPEFVNA